MKKDQRQTLILVAGLVAGYAILKPILNRLGLAKSEETKRREERRKSQIDSKVAEEKKKFKGFLSDAEAQSIADSIYNSLATSAISDSPGVAEAALSKIHSDADWWNVYRLFGRRQEYFFGLPTGGLKDIDQFIADNLSKQAIKRTNDNWDRYHKILSTELKKYGKVFTFNKRL